MSTYQQLWSPVWRGTAQYLGAACGTLLIGWWAGQTPQLAPALVWPLAAGALMPALFCLSVRRGWDQTRVLEIAALCLFAIALISLLNGSRPLVPYGDGQGFTNFLSSAYTFPRWLLGTTAVITLHKLLAMPGIAPHVPQALADPATFLAVTCATAMFIGTIAVLRCWPNRLAVILPVLTPVWALFATGYVEYYPLIAASVLAVLLWCFDKPIHTREAWAVGLIAGLLPVLYFGLAGFSVALVAAYGIARPRKILVVLGCAALSAAVLIAVCWPAGIVSFLSSLFGEISLGERHTAFPRYQFRSAGDHSFFFSTSYALSGSHLRDLAYMFFWGGGWAGPTALLAALAILLDRIARKRLRVRATLDARVLLAAALTAWQLYYFLFMIPKLGPTHDIDLFFVTYMVVACVAGRLLDSRLLDLSRTAAYYVTCVALGNAVAAGFLLAWMGLPARP